MNKLFPVLAYPKTLQCHVSFVTLTLLSVFPLIKVCHYIVCLTVVFHSKTILIKQQKKTFVVFTLYFFSSQHIQNKNHKNIFLLWRLHFEGFTFIAKSLTKIPFSAERHFSFVMIFIVSSVKHFHLSLPLHILFTK